MGITADRLTDVVVPVLADLGLDLYDLEFSGSQLRVLVDRPGGIDLDSLTAATRAISGVLDDADLIAAAYTLEVSSPGIERTLRTPAHFVGAIGEVVKITTRPGAEGDRRIEGRLSAADEAGITVDVEDAGPRAIPYGDLQRAKTVFVDPAAPKPGKGSKPGKAAKPTKAAKAAKPTKAAKPAKGGASPRSTTDTSTADPVTTTDDPSTTQSEGTP
ncbi:MAG: hypothetical protein ACYC2O_08720 [Microthrixaceae bacterium]